MTVHRAKKGSWQICSERLDWKLTTCYDTALFRMATQCRSATVGLKETPGQLQLRFELGLELETALCSTAHTGR